MSSPYREPGAVAAAGGEIPEPIELVTQFLDELQEMADEFRVRRDHAALLCTINMRRLALILKMHLAAEAHEKLRRGRP